MNKINIRKTFFLFFLLSITIELSNAQIFHKNPEKSLFGKTTVNKKASNTKEQKSVGRSKKKQEANDRKLDRIYEKAIRQSQKRSFDIQSPEVKDRMKQNKKEYKARDREKKKKDKSGNKKARGKYK
jgi:alpha-L-fucosidase